MSVRPPGPVPIPGSTTSLNLPGISVATAPNYTGPFSQYAGEQAFQRIDPFSRTAFTHYNAPKAYGVTPIELATVITGQISTLAENQWYTTVALPRVEIKGQLIRFNTITFENTFADIVPYQGVPRIIETSSQSETRTIQRRAIALFTERSFELTDEGQELFRKSLDHMATLSLDTQSFDVIMAYFNARNWNNEWETKNGYYNKKTAMEILEREVSMFAIIQKRGFAKMDSMVTQMHARYGIKLTMWILLQEIDTFLSNVPPEHRVFAIGGERAVDQSIDSIGSIVHGTDSILPAVIYGKKYKVYFARTYAAKDTGPINPLIRPRLIGEYFPMFSAKKENGRTYKSFHRTISVFDEPLDDFVDFSLEQALSGVSSFFDEMTGKPKPIDHFINTRRTMVPNFEEDIKQHFLYRSYLTGSMEVPEPIDTFGEMRPEHFSNDSRIEQARSMVAMMQDIYCECPDLYGAFSKGLEFISEQTKSNIIGVLKVLDYIADNEYKMINVEPDDRVLKSEAVLSYPFDISTGATLTRKMGKQNFNMLDLSSGGLGSLDLLTIDDLRPYFTNWAGLLFLSERKLSSGPLSDNIQSIIGNFVVAVRHIVSKLKQVLYDCPLLDSKYTLPFFPVQSAESVFLNSLPIFQSVPLWIMVRSNPSGELDRRIAKLDSKASDEYKEINQATKTYFNIGTPEIPYSKYVLKLADVIYKFINLKELTVVNDYLTALGIDTFMKTDKTPKNDKIKHILAASLAVLVASNIITLNPILNTTFKQWINQNPTEKYKIFTAELGTNTSIGNGTGLGGDIPYVFVIADSPDDPKKYQLITLNRTIVSIELLTEYLDITYEAIKSKNLDVGKSDMFAQFLLPVITHVTTQVENNGNPLEHSKVINYEISKIIEYAKEDGIIIDDNLNEALVLLQHLKDDNKLKYTEERKIGAKPSSARLASDLVGYPGEYVRSSFTISYEQLNQYSKILKSHSSSLISDRGIPYISVSLPTTNFNQPATDLEIEEFLRTTGINYSSGSSVSDSDLFSLISKISDVNLLYNEKLNVDKTFIDKSLSVMLFGINYNKITPNRRSIIPSSKILSSLAKYLNTLIIALSTVGKREDIPKAIKSSVDLINESTGNIAEELVIFYDDEPIPVEEEENDNEAKLFKRLKLGEIPKKNYFKLKPIIIAKITEANNFAREIKDKRKAAVAEQDSAKKLKLNEEVDNLVKEYNNSKSDAEGLLENMQSDLRTYLLTLNPISNLADTTGGNSSGNNSSTSSKFHDDYMDDDDEYNVLGSTMQHQGERKVGAKVRFSQTHMYDDDSAEFKEAPQRQEKYSRIGEKVSRLVTQRELEQLREANLHGRGTHEYVSRQRAVVKYGYEKYPYPSLYESMLESGPDKIINIILLENTAGFGGNPIFRNNWLAISKNNTISNLDKLIALVTMTAPVTFGNFQNFVQNDIICPANFLLLRPHQRYETGAGIKTIPGKDTGATFVNVEQSDWMRGSNVTVKESLTHYSFESAAVIKNSQLVFVAYDIFCVKCLGGAGTGLYDPETDLTEYNPGEHQYPKDKSIFVAMIPYEEREVPLFIDGSGSLNYYTTTGYTDKRDLPHYSTASLMNAVWGFRLQAERGTQSIDSIYHLEATSEYTPNYQPKNTSMFRGSYKSYDHIKKCLIQRRGHGHFESYVYPGCKEARNGGLKPWIDPFERLVTETMM